MSSVTKAWDWSKNTNNAWLIPSMEIPYLAENWTDKGYKTFLDLGCGLGRHTIYMAKRGFTVTAMDLSDFAVAHVKQWAEREQLQNVTAVHANVLDLPFASESFDCAVAYHSVYHTDTKGFLQALSEIRRVIKPGGELFITMISKNTGSFLHAPPERRIDEHTVSKDEGETGDHVPHFYASFDDILELYKDWEFMQRPREWCDYDIDKTEFFSKHWQMIVRK